MSQGHSRFRAPWLVGLILIFVFIGLFFLPEIVSTYWHLRFGDSITFHAWRVPVPRGWWAFIREDLLIVQKSLRFYQGEDAPTISVGSLSPGQSVDPKALKEAMIRRISNQGYVFQGDRSTQVGNDRVYCLHFADDKDHKKIRISCDSVTAQLSLDFFGQSSEIQDFYSLVGQIKRQDIN